MLVGRPHVGLGVSLEATVLLFAYVLGTRAIYLHGSRTLPALLEPTSALIALVWLVSVALLYARAGRGGA